MNTILILSAVLMQNPFSAAIKQVTPTQPVPDAQWTEVAVAGTTISLPVPEAIATKVFERTAPVNYKTPVPTKKKPKWCPQFPQRAHGYSCGMSSITEDLLGHLQEKHGVALELANELGRAKWQDYHDEISWCDETPERQALFLHPKPAKAGCADGNCPSGGCPTGAATQSSGLFGRWR